MDTSGGNIRRMLRGRSSAPPDLILPRLLVKDPFRLPLLTGQPADGVDVPLRAEAEGLLEGLLDDVARHSPYACRRGGRGPSPTPRKRRPPGGRLRRKLPPPRYAEHHVRGEEGEVLCPEEKVHGRRRLYDRLYWPRDGEGWGYNAFGKVEGVFGRGTGPTRVEVRWH